MAGPLSSETEVVNLALVKLGHPQIADIDDGSAEAVQIKAIWATCRDSSLRSHPWNFAIRRAEIPNEAAAPAWGYDRQYLLPNDPWCLRALELRDEGRGRILDAEWNVEGRYILTNLGSPIFLRYVARVPEVELWDPLFIEALSDRLAADLAEPIIKSSEAHERFMRRYKERVAEARSMDGMEGTPPVIEDLELLAVR
jgi:hypothetical protein